jgi:hypothetical protein
VMVLNMACRNVPGEGGVKRGAGAGERRLVGRTDMRLHSTFRGTPYPRRRFMCLNPEGFTPYFIGSPEEQGCPFLETVPAYSVLHDNSIHLNKR